MSRFREFLDWEKLGFCVSIVASGNSVSHSPLHVKPYFTSHSKLFSSLSLERINDTHQLAIYPVQIYWKSCVPIVSWNSQAKHVQILLLALSGRHLRSWHHMVQARCSLQPTNKNLGNSLWYAFSSCFSRLSFCTQSSVSQTRIATLNRSHQLEQFQHPSLGFSPYAFGSLPLFSGSSSLAAFPPAWGI